ncbi:unnamed protein product [Brugia timori]|uniref:G_PROTEIN_RECEP_F1_2 domain-containing protein n=1 Tax=Brugia timori TaxID=42155 RepID=A0A0R3QY17_9BILA|nr:unnamed protein product [Brugia timori]
MSHRRIPHFKVLLIFTRFPIVLRNSQATLNNILAHAYQHISDWIDVFCYLIVMGCLYILWNMLRIYAFWPRSRADTLGVDLKCKALEGIMIAAILIWLFSGSFEVAASCIWIYGPGQNINIYFQPYHCDNFVYWTAFISVILIIHSMIILFAILLCFCLLCVGLLKDNKP